MLSAFRSDQLVEVFSLKLRATWSDHLENYILGCTKYHLHAFPMYFNAILSYYITTAIPPATRPPQNAEETWTTNLSSVILNILPHFHFSLRHIIVHALSPLALWYWCNMLIQLLSIKYDICHKEFKPKSAAASWNATLSCLLSLRHTIPRGQLRMHAYCIILWTLKISLALYTWTVVNTLAYTTGTTSKHQRATWPKLYRKLIVFEHIVVWYMR